MASYPKDCPARVICSEAEGILHNQINKLYWEYHQPTGTDHGKDCEIELVEDEEFRNHKIEGQIKGTRSPSRTYNNTKISFSLDTKTINYGLNASNAYVLFVVDIETQEVYYQCIQDYFIENPDLLKDIDQQGKKTILIPVNSTLTCDDRLQQLARATFCKIKGRLTKIQPEQEVHNQYEISMAK